MKESLLGHLEQAWHDHMEAAWSEGLPLFNGPPEGSTPANASPYVLPLDVFLRRIEALPGRGFLRRALHLMVDRVFDAGYTIDFLLVGGSFCDVLNSSPKDFDALCLYRRRESELAEPSALATASADAQAMRLDLRFVAMDSEPLLYLKAISYFSILYAEAKPGVEGSRRPGILLIDARRPDNGAQMK